MDKLHFTKMEGTGNDYIYIDCLNCEMPQLSAPEITRLCDRHFGIGADGVVFILPSKTADFRMRMFNVNGTEAEMCGNASRSIGVYLYNRGKTEKTNIKLETKGGIKDLFLNIENNLATSVCVDMGIPSLTPAHIPVISDKEKAINDTILIDGRTLYMSCVSMGNPHAVFFVSEITDEHVLTWGPQIETHPLFPKHTNVEFVQIISKTEMRMRVWERGTGETLACGTGACAALVAASLNGLSDDKATVHLLGGDLKVEWRDDDHVYQTGPANIVFDGTFIF